MGGFYCFCFIFNFQLLYHVRQYCKLLNRILYSTFKNFKLQTFLSMPVTFSNELGRYFSHTPGKYSCFTIWGIMTLDFIAIIPGEILPRVTRLVKLHVTGFRAHCPRIGHPGILNILSWRNLGKDRCWKDSDLPLLLWCRS